MKKCLLTAAAAMVLGGSMTVSAEKWVQLNDMRRAKYPAEVVIGFAHDGHVTPEEQSTGSLRAPMAGEDYNKPGDTGVPFTGVMTNNYYQTWQGANLTTSIYGLAIVGDEALETIEEMPAEAAIVRLDKVAGGYSLYLTNGSEGKNGATDEAGTNGYLRPVLNSITTRGMNGLCVFDQPLAATIENGLISFDQEERNILSFTKQGFMTPPEWGLKNSTNAVLCFSSLNQPEGEGRNVIYIRESDLLDEPAEYTLTPADGASVPSFEDLIIKLNFEGDVKSVVMSDDATDESVVAKWNGEEWGTPGITYRGNPIYINLKSGAPMGSGVYELFIAAGTFEVTYQDGTKRVNPDITYTLTVGGGAVSYTVEPADGATVEDIYRLVFSFDGEYEKIEAVEAGVYGEMTFNGEDYEISSASFNKTRQTLQLVFVEIAEPGEIEWMILPGTYKLTDSEGNEKYNGFMTGTVSVTGTPEVKENLFWEFVPADESTVVAPASVTVTFPDAKEILSVSASYIEVMFGEDYEEIDFKLGEIKGNSFTLNFNEPINRNGEVTVYFYAEAVKMDLEDGSRVYSNEYAYTFTAEEKVPQNWSIVSPEAGNYDEYPTVVIKYEDCTAVVVKEGAKATLTVGTAGSAELDIVAGDEPGEVKFVPAEPIVLYASEYTKNNLVVPAGSYTLTIGGKEVANDELTIDQFKINNPAARLAKCTLEPAPGTQGRAILADMTVKLVSPWAAFGIGGARKISLKKVNEDGSLTDIGNMTATSANVAADKMSFKISYDAWESLEEGNYRIVIPKEAYAVLVDGKRTNCPEQSFDYHLTTVVSVNEVSAAAESNDVYTMTGICVGRNLNAEAVKALPKGLYIVNGKKTAVR